MTTRIKDMTKCYINPMVVESMSVANSSGTCLSLVLWELRQDDGEFKINRRCIIAFVTGLSNILHTV